MVKHTLFLSVYYSITTAEDGFWVERKLYL
jgi:hypothetical protein